MEKAKILEGLKKLRETSKKRKFEQSFDLQVGLSNIDLNKSENQINEFLVLPKGRGKRIKVAAFVDKDILTEARKIFDTVILKDEFAEWAKNPRKIRNLVRAHKFFVAQADIMALIAKTFGKFLGQKGRMPSPKAGAVIPPRPEVLKPIMEKLQRTVHLQTKKQPSLNCVIGSESMKDEDIAANVLNVYESIEKALPRGNQQIKSVKLKLSMGGSVAL